MRAQLVTFGKKGVRKDFPLTGGTIVIGRKMDADLRIPLTEVSRLHCEIAVDGEEITLRDLNSSNGTYVNDQKVSKAGLKAGDHLRIGPVVFTLQIDGMPENLQPVASKAKAKAASADRPTVIPTEAAPTDVDADDSDVFDIDDLDDVDIAELSDLDLEEVEDVEEVDLSDIDSDIDEVDVVEEVDDK